MTAITRRTLIGAAASAIALPALIRPASARTRAITVASLMGDDRPETKIWVKIAALVEEKLPGRFRFNIVKNGALGGEKEVAEGIRLGSVQASLATASALSGWVPALQILDLPFLYRDGAHVRKTVEGPIGADLKAKLSTERFVVGDFIDYGARHLLTKVPVTRPEGIRGKTIRVIQSPLHTKLWSAFGAVPVGIPITETYNALSIGVADAMDLTLSATVGFKLYEVVPCLTETAHIRASGVVYYGADVWDGLDAEEHAVFTQASRDGAAFFNRLVQDDEAQAVATIRERGGQVLKPEALDAWRAGAGSVWTDMAEVVGGRDRIAEIQAL